MQNIKNFFTQAQLNGFGIIETSLTKKELGFQPPALYPDFVKQDFMVSLTRNWEQEQVITLRKDKDGLRFDNMPTKTTTVTIDGKKKKVAKEITMKELDKEIEGKSFEEIVAILLK